MRFSFGPKWAMLVSVVALTLSGCGGGDDKKVATQVAAKVNKEEISVHQINDLLQRTQNLRPEQAKQASRQILDRLIDQELLVQQAVEKKLDRDPRVVQAIAASRREILARALVEQIASTAPKPTAAETAEFYAKHPELFRERRIYNMRELAIGLKADALTKLQEEMKQAKDVGELIEWLKGEQIPFTANNTVKSAEQLPLELVGRFHQMKDGQTALIPAPNGILIVQLLGSQTQPLDEKQAGPFIEQFLTNKRKAELAAGELKALKAKAKIEYVGEFVKTADELKAGQATPAPMLDPAAGAAAPSQLEQGVKGLK